MTGRKTLAEVRAELEAALRAGPTDDSDIAKSLRRFLAARPTPRPSESVDSDASKDRGTSSQDESIGR